MTNGSDGELFVLHGRQLIFKRRKLSDVMGDATAADVVGLHQIARHLANEIATLGFGESKERSVTTA